MLFGCHAKQQAVQAETATTKESFLSLISVVQPDDPPEVVTCMNDLLNQQKNIRVISNNCKYNSKLDHNIVVTIYRAGLLDGWQSGKLQNVKMKYFGLLAFVKHYPFSQEDLAEINNTIDLETKKQQKFEVEAERRRVGMNSPENCIDTEIKKNLYDMGWECGQHKTLDTQCIGYRESFTKICDAVGANNCSELYDKERPEHCL
jgi:hypothetical protein